MKSGTKIVFSAAAILIIAAAVIFYMFRSEPDLNYLNPVHRYLSFSIYNTWTKYFAELPDTKRSIVSYDSLMNQLNWFERQFAEKVFSVNPAELGFKGPYFGRAQAENLTMIPSVALTGAKNKRETGITYCPTHSFLDYERMMSAMLLDTDRRLFVDSGYRSPGRQAYLFFYYLVLSNDYNMTENAKWIAMPGYSEHGSPLNNAIDFVSIEGINGFDEGQTAADFEKLAEYSWLTGNAARFNFFLSYPKNNPHGVAYEPWHWHWDGKKDTTASLETVIK